MGKLLIGINDLATKNPTLAAQWDFEKNNGLTPEQVASGSHKKAWWKCPQCQHSWEAQINARNRGNGCPECGKKSKLKKYRKTRLQQGNNTLSALNSPVLSEWDYTRNKELLPEDVTPHTSQKAWWKCSICGQSWKARIAGRTYEGKGCPVCRGNIVVPGINDLASINPSVAKEWDVQANGAVLPTQVTANSSKKVAWICSVCGHKWKTTIASRNQGTGCPQCAKTYRTSLPEQIVFYYIRMHFGDAVNGYQPAWLNGGDIDIYISSLQLGIEYDGQHWHADPFKDQKKAALAFAHGIQLIRIREPGLPPLHMENGNILLIKELDKNYEYLKNTIETLALLVNARFGQKWVPEVDISKDLSHILSTYERSKKEQSLAFKFPELVKEWDISANRDLSPDQVTAGSDKKVWWKCSRCGFSWQASVGDRTRGHSCPYCAGSVLRTGFNDLQTKRPEVASEWCYAQNGDLLPSQVAYRGNHKAWWECKKCGYIWQSRIADRSNGVGCPACSGKAVFPGQNDLATLNPGLAAEWDFEKNHNMQPTAVTPNSNKRAYWRCKSCGHSWGAAIYARNAGRGCPMCGNENRKKTHMLPQPGDSLQDLYPKLAGEWHSVKNGAKTAAMIYPNSHSVAWWQCSSCGHEFERRIQSHVKSKRCPVCKSKVSE